MIHQAFRSVAAAALFALSALIGAPALAAAAPSPAQLAAATAAQERGEEIYAYDQAAWHSTDVYRDDLKKAGKAGLADFGDFDDGGFVVEPAEDDMLLVSYYGAKNDKPTVIARYWVRGDVVVRGGLLKAGESSALSPLGALLVRTRSRLFAAAVADEAQVCSKDRPNTVILPPRADGTIPAYLMTPQTKAGSFPAGGHHLYVFDANGKIISRRAFTKSCLLVNWAALPKDAAGFGVSHKLDPQPSEIHVFISLMMPISLFVLTEQNNFLWEVDLGKITFKQVMKNEDLPN